jgi:hypothetical protein
MTNDEHPIDALLAVKSPATEADARTLHPPRHV